ncbi:reverse transcriptase domain-containing protein [Tanacetum coccineum]|uniref:Reverse transcriptase domain-containing protein n=1 Tax=Tanacetum coccineum TaxID=301880 RepID=A0ABQ5GIA9_9ASTR
MPTWCHMFNSTLTGNARVWFDDLLKESIDSYDDLKKAFLENYLQQKKCIKDPIEIHNIKQRDGESTEEFVRRQRRQKQRNLLKRQATGNPDGTTMAEGSQTKDYPNLLSGDGNLIFPLRGGGWDGGSYDYRGRDGGHFVHRIKMIPAATPLVGFSGEIIWPLGQISLLVKIGDEEHSTSAWMNFMVVRSPSPYNEIIGRLGVRRIQAVPSTTHGMLKFLVTGGTVTLRSSRIVPLEYTMVSGLGA